MGNPKSFLASRRCDSITFLLFKTTCVDRVNRKMAKYIEDFRDNQSVLFNIFVNVHIQLDFSLFESQNFIFVVLLYIAEPVVS